MKRFSLAIRRSRTDFVLVLLASVIAVDVFVLFATNNLFRTDYFLYATRLEEKPLNYFVLDKPDSNVLEAISKGYVQINSPEDTQIDDLALTYGNNNVEINGNYYEVSLVVGDHLPPAVSIAVLVASAIGITYILLFKLGLSLKNHKSQS